MIFVQCVAIIGQGYKGCFKRVNMLSYSVRVFSGNMNERVLKGMMTICIIGQKFVYSMYLCVVAK